MKRYAKNPSELVIQNPDKNSKKMGKSKRKRDSKGRFMSKSRKNKTADKFVDRGQDLLMQYGLAALAATGATKGAQFVLSQIPVNLPDWARDWLIIGLPGAAGVGVSLYSNKNNAIAQGIAGGMVLSTANSLSDKLIKGESPGMADSFNLPAGSMIIKPDGTVVDSKGTPVAKANIPEKAKKMVGAGNGTPKSIASNIGPFGQGKYESHLLQDGASNNWESGESY
jgi:hypothetical protein